MRATWEARVNQARNSSPAARSHRAVGALISQLFGLMANRLDVIAIGIKDKRAKITGMVLRPWTRGPVVRAAGIHSSSVECLNIRAARRDKRDVYAAR